MPSPYFLHIDTATMESYVCISSDNVEILSSISIPANQQAALINSSIDEVIQRSNLIPNDISAISVNNGPGSYTGLRVALATAKGLALGWNIPIILHNYIDLLASTNQVVDTFAIILKARDKEYFVGIYSNEKCLFSPVHLMVEQVWQVVENHTVNCIFTDDVETFFLKNRKTFSLNKEIKKSLSILTGQRFQEKSFDDIAYSEPFYLKPAYVTTSKNNILHKN